MFLYAHGSLYNLDQVQAVLPNKTVELWGEDPETPIARISSPNPARTVKEIARTMSSSGWRVAVVEVDGDIGPLT